MINIRTGTLGEIIEGDNKGGYVKIINDSENTGGFLILLSDRKDFSEGFDDWVENKDSLESYFRESRWKIKWFS